MNERNPGAHDPQQPRAICVYCSSSNHVDKTYLDAAGDTGEAIAKRGYRLIYGGVRIGLMGALARRARLHGAPMRSWALLCLINSTPNISPIKTITTPSTSPSVGSMVTRAMRCVHLQR